MYLYINLPDIFIVACILVFVDVEEGFHDSFNVIKIITNIIQN